MITAFYLFVLFVLIFILHRFLCYLFRTMDKAQQQQLRPAVRRSIVTRLTSDLHETYHTIDKLRAKQHQRLQQQQQQQQQQQMRQSCDDEKNDYIFREGEVWLERFKIVSQLGKGSFGQVFEATDISSDGGGRNVAIKVIKNRKSFHNQALMEIRILELLNSRDSDDSNHIVRMKEHFIYRNHLCIVYELLSLNLYEVVKQGHFSGLHLSFIRKIAAQILKSLKLLAQTDVQVIHCDLKPENILLCSNGSTKVKVIDFGSSCFIQEKAYTYIQSRFYRSPEVILGLSYSTPIDMWSLGCILFELFSGEPLFSGQTEHDQLLRIMDLIGLPPRSMLDSGAHQKVSAMFHKTISRPPLPPYPTNSSSSSNIGENNDKIAAGSGRNVENNTNSSNTCTAIYRPLVPSSFQTRNTNLPDLLHMKFQRALQQGKHSHPISYVPANKNNNNGSGPTTTTTGDQQSINNDSHSLNVYCAFLADFEKFANLIMKMLVYDPAERITPEEALQHPFLRKPAVEREVNTNATMKSVSGVGAGAGAAAVAGNGVRYGRGVGAKGGLVGEM
ncbi:kinase-like domain-containing protein [Obelidium mucronatum]|nr:kinase-like domain-containing protein [Obelidium mucronatum]